MKTFARSILYGMRYRGGFWFRLLGFGLLVRDIRAHPLVFSEREGCVWFFLIGPWMIKPLFPQRQKPGLPRWVDRAGVREMEAGAPVKCGAAVYLGSDGKVYPCREAKP